MSAVEYQPRPLRVSPLIKFGRWTFLTAGILWGIMKHRRYTKQENALREIERIQKPMKDAKLAEEKRIALAAEMKMLSEYGIH